MANKYTDEMLLSMGEFGDTYDAEIPYADVTAFKDDFNEEFGTEFSQRMVAGKLRHLEYDLEKKGSSQAAKKYTEEEEDII